MIERKDCEECNGAGIIEPYFPLESERYCNKCYGTGSIPPKSHRICMMCKGSGIFMAFYDNKEYKCPLCENGYDNVDRWRGIYPKYNISKNDGSPIDPNAKYFILRYDNSVDARRALLVYALSTDNVTLKDELLKEVELYGGTSDENNVCD